MATCTLCAKKSNKVNSRSHSMRPTIRRQNVNLQTVLVQGKRVVACVKCINGIKHAS